MISVDYENLCVTGDWSSKFKTKEEMFKAVTKYVLNIGKDLHGGKYSDKPYIFKRRTNERRKV
jgi:hypothetical protein